MSYICVDCRDTGVISQHGSSLTCPFCSGRHKLIKGLKSRIQRAKKQRNRPLYNKLVAVSNFLPEYPVMAVMEAEAQDLEPEFISFIKSAFHVLVMMEPKDRKAIPK